MYFIGKLKLDVSTQDNINAAFFKYLYLLYLLLHSMTFKNSNFTIISISVMQNCILVSTWVD